MRETEIGLCWGTLQNARLLELIDVAGVYGFPTSVTPHMVLRTLERDLDAPALRAAARRRRRTNPGDRRHRR